ncbi:MAG: Rho termination factor N-terminal domain-containing protein, partial [Candidatus Nanopelagicales bacterium]
MLLPELKQLAQRMGITGASGMRKGDLVAAISDRERPSAAPASAESAGDRPRRSARRDQAAPDAPSGEAPSAAVPQGSLA